MTSRRELYAHGEPLGDNVTRAKLGGGYVCGGGGDSSSSSTQATTTNQYDQRQIFDQRQQNDNRTWTNNQTDARNFSTSTSTNISDAFKTTLTNSNNTTKSWTNNQTDSRDFSTKTSDAFNTSLTNSNNTTNNLQVLDGGAIEAGKSVALAGIANNSTNTDHLLAVADSLFSKTQDTLNANTKLAASLASGANQAYSDATSQATGNKNIVYAGMAVIGIVAVSMLMKKA